MIEKILVRNISTSISKSLLILIMKKEGNNLLIPKGIEVPKNRAPKKPLVDLLGDTSRFNGFLGNQNKPKRYPEIFELQTIIRKENNRFAA